MSEPSSIFRPRLSLQTWLFLVSVAAWNFAAVGAYVNDRPKVLEAWILDQDRGTYYKMSDESVYIQRHDTSDPEDRVYLRRRAPSYDRPLREELRFRLQVTPLILAGWAAFTLWSKLNRNRERTSWTSSPPSN